jgi:hypothetical protein
MKTILSLQELSEVEIKPNAATEEWRRLVAADLAQLGADRAGWVSTGCPACDSRETRPAFAKLGIDYLECASCASLFAALRPDEAAVWQWYRASKSANYWRESLIPATDTARLEKVVRPRADWILDGIAEYRPTAKRLVDYSTYGQPLLDLLAHEAGGIDQIVAAGMTADVDGHTAPRVRIVPTGVKDFERLGKADVAVAVDVMDRTTDPKRLVSGFRNMLNEGGVLFATFPVASGFEVQTLWENSPTVFPPDKLNLPTVDGLLKLFAAPAWEILELSTTGMFDVDTVIRTMAALPNYPWPRAVRSLVHHDDPNGRAAFVEFLQSRRLTSFARLVARRRA